LLPPPSLGFSSSRPSRPTNRSASSWGELANLYVPKPRLIAREMISPLLPGESRTTPGFALPEMFFESTRIAESMLRFSDQVSLMSQRQYVRLRDAFEDVRSRWVDLIAMNRTLHSAIRHVQCADLKDQLR